MWYHFQPKRGYFCRGRRGSGSGSRYSLNSLIYVYISVAPLAPSGARVASLAPHGARTLRRASPGAARWALRAVKKKKLSKEKKS